MKTIITVLSIFVSAYSFSGNNLCKSHNSYKDGWTLYKKAHSENLNKLICCTHAKPRYKPPHRRNRSSDGKRVLIAGSCQECVYDYHCKPDGFICPAGGYGGKLCNQHKSHGKCMNNICYPSNIVTREEVETCLGENENCREKQNQLDKQRAAISCGMRFVDACTPNCVEFSRNPHQEYIKSINRCGGAEVLFKSRTNFFREGKLCLNNPHAVRYIIKRCRKCFHFTQNSDYKHSSCLGYARKSSGKRGIR